MDKTANQLYRESGTSEPFKTWLEQQKASGNFLYNKPLNEKINNMNNVGQHSFHSADGTGSNSNGELANPALASAPSTESTSILSTFSKRDAMMLTVGAGGAIIVFFIVKKLIHG